MPKLYHEFLLIAKKSKTRFKRERTGAHKLTLYGVEKYGRNREGPICEL